MFFHWRISQVHKLKTKTAILLNGGFFMGSFFAENAISGKP
jgi:hypothetical protein